MQERTLRPTTLGYLLGLNEMCGSIGMSLLAATVGVTLVVQQVGRHTPLEYRYTSIRKAFAERQVLYQCLSRNGDTGTRFCM